MIIFEKQLAEAKYQCHTIITPDPTVDRLRPMLIMILKGRRMMKNDTQHKLKMVINLMEQLDSNK